MAGKPRSLLEGETYRQSLAAIDPDARRTDEALFGVTWALSKDAESVSWNIPGTTVRVMLTDAFPGLPALRIYLTMSEDDSQVVLLWVEPRDAEG